MAYDPNNIFAKILRGEIPCVKVYEDAKTLAFMDVMPQADGHVLVIPKEAAENVFELSPEGAAALMATTQRIAKAVKKGLGVPGIMIVQLNGAAAGQTVFHVHFHIIPAPARDFKLHAREMEKPEKLKAIAEKIKAALNECRRSSNPRDLFRSKQGQGAGLRGGVATCAAFDRSEDGGFGRHRDVGPGIENRDQYLLLVRVEHTRKTTRSGSASPIGSRNGAKRCTIFTNPCRQSCITASRSKAPLTYSGFAPRLRGAASPHQREASWSAAPPGGGGPDEAGSRSFYTFFLRLLLA